jgi:hypothetical protein
LCGGRGRDCQRFCAANIAGCLEASGSAEDNRAKSSRPQKLPPFHAGIQNQVCRKAVDADATR